MAIAVPGSRPTVAGGSSNKGINKSKGKPDAPPAGRLISTWPIVQCATSGCTVESRWNLMHETRNTVNPGGSGKFGDDADPEEVVSYRCSTCMSKVWNCSVPDAQSRILAERPSLAKKRAKNEAFKVADNKAAEALPALSNQRGAQLWHRR